MLISRVEPMWISQRSAMPEREQELDIDGIGGKGNKARHFGEVIRRILLGEHIGVDRYPLRYQLMARSSVA
jgi:hypothetical protein